MKASEICSREYGYEYDENASRDLKTCFSHMIQSTNLPMPPDVFEFSWPILRGHYTQLCD